MGVVRTDVGHSVCVCVCVCVGMCVYIHIRTYIRICVCVFPVHVFGSYSTQVHGCIGDWYIIVAVETKTSLSATPAESPVFSVVNSCSYMQQLHTMGVYCFHTLCRNEAFGVLVSDLLFALCK